MIYSLYVRVVIVVRGIEVKKMKKEFIAEIGINHNGDMKLVKEMIDMAVICKVNVVKFQKRNPNKAVPEHQKNVEKIVPWRKEPTTYLQYKKDIELSKEDYDEIDSYCRERDIKWTASVWDLDSIEFLCQYDVPFIKIPSALITNNDLLRACKSTGKKIYMSTGMSTEEEINKAIEILGDSLDVLFHCNSSYPAKDKELNLSYITMMKINYPKLTIGYSGHEEGISACVVAGVLGAEVFERHITLSRSMWGTDQAASIVFDQLYKLRRDLEKVNEWIGLPIKKVTDSEIPIRLKLRGN